MATVRGMGANQRDVLTSETMAVSFIVPAFNAERSLAGTIATIRAAAPEGAEVVIVDDGSLDGTRELAAGLADKLVCRPCQSGAARARNDACRVASGNVYVFVDSDVTVRPDAVAGLLEHLRRGADAVYGAYEALPPSDVRNAPTDYKNLIHHFTHLRGATEQSSTFWSGFSAIRADAFWAVDGFDPTTTRSADIEDIHLGYRLNAAGFRIVLDPSLQAVHHKRYTIRGLVASDFFHRAIPWSKAMVELQTASLDLNLKREAITSAVMIWGLVVTAPLPLVLGRRVAVIPLTLGAGWTLFNLDFLRYVRSVAGVKTMLSSGGFHAASGVYSPPGAALGLGHAYLRPSANASIRNRLSLELLQGTQPDLEVSLAVVVPEGAGSPCLDVLPTGQSFWELLVVTSDPSGLRIPDHARVITAPVGSNQHSMRQLALDEAKGKMLAILDGDLVPGPGWLDRVRAAGARGDLAIGGSFEHGATPLRYASSLTLWSYFRPEARASWLDEHPSTNIAFNSLAARRVGGFDEPEALLRRLSGFGAHPLRFDPDMSVTVHPASKRARLRGVFGLGRSRGSAMVRNYDHGRRLRLAVAGYLPWRLAVQPVRIVRDAAREGRLGATFWLAFPFAVVGLSTLEFGRVAGCLRPDHHDVETRYPKIRNEERPHRQVSTA